MTRAPDDAPEVADVAVTPTAILAAVATARVAADAAEAQVLALAVEWAVAHPVPEGAPEVAAWRIGPSTAVPLSRFDATAMALDPSDPEAEEAVGWCGIPPVAWDAPAAFAAANRMSTTGGKALIRDALVLHHRLPRVWARVLAGDVTSWRARRIAQAVLGAPADVVAYVDSHVAPVAGTIGSTALDRLLEEAMLRLHAEEVELEQVEAREATYVRLHGDADPVSGLAEMSVRADWKDLRDFDRSVALVAAALAAQGSGESLDVRRALAIGILADPAQAQALLAGDDPPPPSKQAVLYLHLSDLAVLGLDAVGRNETTQRAVLTQLVHEWLGRTDTHVVVKPVLDLAQHQHTEAYEVPDRMREQVGLLDQSCVFPWCTRPSRRCDCDHIVAFDDDGSTCVCNLAPLCRHHHRLKTTAGWRYRRLETGVHLWADPFGHRYLRDRGGTSIVSQT